MNENAVAIVPSNQVTIAGEVNIGMQEIVSVGVARMERKLKTAIKAMRSEITTLEADISAQNKELEEMALDLVSTKDFRQDVEALLTKFSITSITLKEGVDINPTKQEVVCEWRLINSSSVIRIRTTTVPFSENMVAFCKGIEGLREILQAKKLRLLEFSRKAGDINFLERQMKARVTESQLQKSESGRELLEASLEQFDVDMDLMG